MIKIINYTFDTDKIARQVRIYLHLPENDDSICEAVDNAATYLCTRLTRAPVTDAEIALCEFAAEAITISDMAKINASFNESISTASGTFSQSEKGLSAPLSATKLVDEALSRLGDMLDTDNFFFEGVDG